MVERLSEFLGELRGVFASNPEGFRVPAELCGQFVAALADAEEQARQQESVIDRMAEVEDGCNALFDRALEHQNNRRRAANAVSFGGNVVCFPVERRRG